MLEGANSATTSPGSVVTVEEGVTVTITKILIRDGWAEETKEGPACGGGVPEQGPLGHQRLADHRKLLRGQRRRYCNIAASLTMTGSSVVANAAVTNGGAIYNYSGHIVLNGTPVNHNSVESDGGAIQTEYGSASLTNSPVTYNTSKATGGGIYAEYGFLTLKSSELTRNRDAIRTEKSAFCIVEMHGAAAAARAPIHSAQQFRHRSPCGNSLGQCVAMTAMRAGNVVVAPQLRAYAGCNRFFPDIRVDEPGHAARPEYLARLELEPSNQSHLAIESKHQFFGRL